MRDRATELAGNMVDFALSHSRESFKVHGSRQKMLDTFLPFAEIIAGMERIAERNDENIRRTQVFLDRQQKMMSGTTAETYRPPSRFESFITPVNGHDIPDYPPDGWS